MPLFVEVESRTVSVPVTSPAYFVAGLKKGGIVFGKTLFDTTQEAIIGLLPEGVQLIPSGEINRFDSK
jgi:hypothetical protein